MILQDGFLRRQRVLLMTTNFLIGYHAPRELSLCKMNTSHNKLLLAAGICHLLILRTVSCSPQHTEFTLDVMVVYFTVMPTKLVQQLGYRLDNWGGSRFLAETLDFFFSKVSSLQCGLGALSTELKRPRRGADHTPPSSAEVMNVWNCISTAL